MSCNFAHSFLSPLPPYLLLAFFPHSYCDKKFVDCGAKNCSIQSPGYPGIYPRNITCQYLLMASEPEKGDKFIRIWNEADTFDVDGPICADAW